MSWTAIVILAIGVYAMKAAGPMLFAGRSLPAHWNGVATMVAVLHHYLALPGFHAHSEAHLKPSS